MFSSGSIALEQYMGATYVRHFKKFTETVHCYTCGKEFSSDSGFNKHVKNDSHMTIPTEYPMFYEICEL